MSTTTLAPDSLPTAELDRRFYAFTLDRLLSWTVYGVAAWAAWVLLIEPGQVAAGVVVVVGTVLVVGVVQAFVLGLLGTSPGKAAVGLRVVDDTTGTPIGVGPALLRTLVLGVATLPTFGFGVATLAWTAVMDRHHQRRGWHDHLTRSVVVDVRPAPPEAEQAPERPRQIVNLTAMRLVPASPTPPREVPARVRRSRWSAVPTVEAATAGDQATPTQAAAEGLLGHPDGAPSPGPSREVTLAAPAAAAAPSVPDLEAAPAPAAPITPPVAPAAAVPASPPVVPAAAVPATPPVVPPVAPEPGVRRVDPVPAVEPTPAVPPVPVTQPGKRAARGPVAPAVPARWRVAFDTGEELVVGGFTLVGRNPEPRPGEAVKRLLALPSADMSLSKTHAQFQVVPDGALVVMDRGSTNGSLLIRGGVTRELAAGRPASLRDGDVVRFGDREMRVAREQ